MKRPMSNSIDRIRAYDVEIGDLLMWDEGPRNAAARLKSTNIRLVLQVITEDDGTYSYMMFNALGNLRVWKLTTGHKTNKLMGFMKVA